MCIYDCKLCLFFIKKLTRNRPIKEENMMKKLVFTITSIALLTSFSLTACSEKEKPSTEISLTPEAIEPIETEELEQTPEQILEETEEIEQTPEQISARKVYQQQITSELQKLNSQIDQLQTQAGQSEALAKEKLNKRIDELISKIQVRSQLNAELENEMGELFQQLQQESEPNVQLNDLIQKQTLVQQKIEALLIADESTWEQTRFELDEALTNLKQSYEKFQPKPIVTESTPITPKSVELVPADSSSKESDIDTSDNQN